MVQIKKVVRNEARSPSLINITWCQKLRQKKKMAQFQPPLHLSLQGNLAENWGSWIQHFELFCTGEKSKKVQCATFLHVAGEETIKVRNTLSLGTTRVTK